MKHTTLLFLFLVTVFLVAFDGCIHRPNPTLNGDEDTITTATTEIDTGDYEDAVNNLQGYLSNFPADDRVRLLLSNAYVRWAGIKFSDFIPLAHFYLDQSKKGNSFTSGEDSLVKALRRSQNSSLGTAAEAVEDFEKLFSTLEAFSAAFDLIPDLDESQFAHFSEGLKQAILITSPKRGDMLYRVVLRVVNLKFNWVHRDVFKFMDGQCKILPKSFLNFLNNTRSEYQTISSELTYVYPNLGDELGNKLNQFDKTASQVEGEFENIFGRSADPEGVSPDASHDASPAQHSVWDCI